VGTPGTPTDQPTEDAQLAGVGAVLGRVIAAATVARPWSFAPSPNKRPKRERRSGPNGLLSIYASIRPRLGPLSLTL